MLVGTGDVPSALSFYEHCGFTISHRVENFFTDNYDHPMYEDGEQLVDMVYLKKTFQYLLCDGDGYRPVGERVWKLSKEIQVIRLCGWNNRTVCLYYQQKNP